MSLAHVSCHTALVGVKFHWEVKRCNLLPFSRSFRRVMPRSSRNSLEPIRKEQRSKRLATTLETRQSNWYWRLTDSLLKSPSKAKTSSASHSFCRGNEKAGPDPSSRAFRLPVSAGRRQPHDVFQSGKGEMLLSPSTSRNHRIHGQKNLPGPRNTRTVSFLTRLDLLS